MAGLSFENMPRWAVVMFAVLLLIGALAEIAITWILVEHVPWLGWPLTVLSVAGVIYAVIRRIQGGRRARG